MFYWPLKHTEFCWRCMTLPKLRLFSWFKRKILNASVELGDRLSWKLRINQVCSHGSFIKSLSNVTMHFQESSFCWVTSMISRLIMSLRLLFSKCSSIHLATPFSISIEMKGRLKIGWLFFISTLSNPGLLSNGVMVAHFKHNSITDSSIDLLTMAVISGRSWLVWRLDYYLLHLKLVKTFWACFH